MVMGARLEASGLAVEARAAEAAMRPDLAVGVDETAFPAIARPVEDEIAEAVVAEAVRDLLRADHEAGEFGGRGLVECRAAVADDELRRLGRFELQPLERMEMA